MPVIDPDDGEPIPWDEPTEDPPPPGEGDEDADCDIAADDSGWPVWVGYHDSKMHWRLRLPGAEYVGEPTRDECWTEAEVEGPEEWADNLEAIGATVHTVKGAAALTKIAELRAAASV